MSTRDRLAEIPAGTELLRNVRHLTELELADLTDTDLEHAARWLRAAGYSARMGADHLDAELRRRHERTPTCSDPRTTTPSSTKPSTEPASETPDEPSTP